MSEVAGSAISDDLEEQVQDFSRRFAHLVVNRGFATSTATSARDASTADQRLAQEGANGASGEQSLLGSSVAEAELSLRAAQRQAVQIQEDADRICSRVLPSLRENARQLVLLFDAIDRVHAEVMPQVEGSLNQMEKAMYEMEEMRKAQAEALSESHGSYGLGSPWGAGLWSPRGNTEVPRIPDIFETSNLFGIPREDPPRL